MKLRWNEVLADNWDRSPVRSALGLREAGVVSGLSSSGSGDGVCQNHAILRTSAASPVLCTPRCHVM